MLKPPLTTDDQVDAPSGHRRAAGRAGFSRRIAWRLSLLVRAALPLAIVALGFAGYNRLAVPTDEAKAPPAPAQKLRTAVTELHVVDFPVVVTTQGIVQAHNEVPLSAEVAGQVRSISASFQVGAYFKRGDVLLRLDARDYETAVQIARAQVQSHRAALLLAEQSYARSVTLNVKNVVSEAELSQALATKAQAAAQLASTEAQLEQAERDLTRTKILAAFDGRVRQRSVGVGQTLSIGTPLGVVFSIEFAEVRLPIAARELAFLELPELAHDLAIDVTLRDAINRANQATWNAKIVRTEGALDADSLELFAIARIDDPFGLASGHAPVRIGQPVEAMITGTTLTDVVPIPRMAVRQRDRVVLVNEETMTLHTKTIEPIWSDEENVVVRHDEIIDGTLLATTHLVYTPEGAAVEIIAEPNTATGSADESDQVPAAADDSSAD